MPYWEYLVEYGDGIEYVHTIQAPSLGIYPFHAELRASLEDMPIQKFKGDLLLRSNQREMQSKIKHILQRINLYTDENKLIWRNLFKRFPKADHKSTEIDDLLAPIDPILSDDTDWISEHVNVLFTLSKLHGWEQK